MVKMATNNKGLKLMAVDKNGLAQPIKINDHNELLIDVSNSSIQQPTDLQNHTLTAENPLPTKITNPPVKSNELFYRDYLRTTLQIDGEELGDSRILLLSNNDFTGDTVFPRFMRFLAKNPNNVSGTISLTLVGTKGTGVKENVELFTDKTITSDYSMSPVHTMDYLDYVLLLKTTIKGPINLSIRIGTSETNVDASRVLR